MDVDELVIMMVTDGSSMVLNSSNRAKANVPVCKREIIDAVYLFFFIIEFFSFISCTLVSENKKNAVALSRKPVRVASERVRPRVHDGKKTRVRSFGDK